MASILLILIAKRSFSFETFRNYFVCEWIQRADLESAIRIHVYLYLTSALLIWNCLLRRLRLHSKINMIVYW